MSHIWVGWLLRVQKLANAAHSKKPLLSRSIVCNLKMLVCICLHILSPGQFVYLCLFLMYSICYDREKK